MLRAWASIVAVGALLGACKEHRAAPMASAAATAAASTAPTPSVPPPADIPKSGRIGHVFLVILENEGISRAFGKGARASYLAEALPAQGVLLQRYYGIGHNSLPNYIAMVSGQGPNPTTQQDCVTFEDFVGTLPEHATDGQAVGKGCVYPKSVRTLPDQLESAAPSPFTWKGYMEDMGNDPKREASTCGHPALDTRDGTQEASAKDQYATRHDPFVYFHSIIDDEARCREHVVNLDRLTHDLSDEKATPNLSVIVPNLCNDGHDTACANGDPGGLVSIDAFLRAWVPRILASPAFRDDGMLVINFDEAETAYADSTACREMPVGPNTDQPGIIGPGGGVTGAIVISAFVTPGTVSKEAYDHYSLLKSFEQIFGVPYLGYAASPAVQAFGPDVFTRAVPQFPPRP